jgi:hypothetical protein
MLTWVCLVGSNCQRLACRVHLTIVCAVLAIACVCVATCEQRIASQEDSSKAE